MKHINKLLAQANGVQILEAVQGQRDVLMNELLVTMESIGQGDAVALEGLGSAIKNRFQRIREGWQDMSASFNGIDKDALALLAGYQKTLQGAIKTMEASGEKEVTIELKGLSQHVTDTGNAPADFLKSVSDDLDSYTTFWNKAIGVLDGLNPRYYDLYKTIDLRSDEFFLASFAKAFQSVTPLTMYKQLGGHRQEWLGGMSYMTDPKEVVGIAQGNVESLGWTRFRIEEREVPNRSSEVKVSIADAVKLAKHISDIIEKSKKFEQVSVFHMDATFARFERMLDDLTAKGENGLKGFKGGDQLVLYLVVYWTNLTGFVHFRMYETFRSKVRYATQLVQRIKSEA